VENSPGRATWRETLRGSKLLILVELLCVVGVFVADQHHLIYLSKTPYLAALACLSLAVRGVHWREIGLRGSDRWVRLVLMGIAAGIAMEALELFVTQPVLVAITGKFPDLSDFHKLIGNVKLLLILIGLSWVAAGFGEEFVWRGYLLNRLADLFGRHRAGWAIALIAMSAAFGLAHAYQGVTGIVENTIAGLLLGGLYLASGRNLLVPIIAHGITDTCDFLLIYSGHYPGMH